LTESAERFGFLIYFLLQGSRQALRTARREQRRAPVPRAARPGDAI
jgi:hypothetical protein